MKFVIKKDELIQAVSELNSILVPGTTYRAISFIMVKATKDKGVILEATDYEINLKKVLDANVIEEGALGIPGKYLNMAIKDFEDEDIEVEQVKSEKVIIRGANKNISFLGLAENEYPVYPEIEEKDSFILPSTILKNNIKRTGYAVSKDTANMILVGSLWDIEKEKKQITMVATDSHRMVVNRIKTDFQKLPEENIRIIVPEKLLNYLSNTLPLSDIPVSIVITQDGSKIAIKYENNEVISKLIVGNYPDYYDIIPDTSTMKQLKVKKNPVLKAIKFVSILAEKKSYNVNLNFNKDSLNVYSDLTDVGEAKDIIALENPDIEPINFILNINFIKEALTWFENEDLIMFYSDVRSPILITDEKDDDYFTMMMPIRPIE
ncbi:DNA polymerase III subunit beta [bacterium]|nr:DNA polymerase III subunit beta [bacterium]